MHTFYVELGQYRYPIHVGVDLLNKPDILTALVSGQQVLVVTNSTVAPLFLDKVKKSFNPLQCDVIILPDGEQYKTLETAKQIFDLLITKVHNRKTTLVALGGGVIGDITGFVAACYTRGVNFMQIPTTLLAQVDAAIGGKTAVNHPLGKNMIGAFHQPVGVIIDIETLRTLPNREYSAGLSEIIKYGLIKDAAFFTWLEKNFAKLLARDSDSLIYAIQRCCEIKASLVVLDEREIGLRALLNLGHSFAHAIESGTGYNSWLHGEAVAVGMLIAVDLSARLGWLNKDVLIRLKSLIVQANLPIELPETITIERILELMAGDKKNIHGRLRLVLLKAVGEAVVTEEAPLEKIQQTLAAYRK